MQRWLQVLFPWCYGGCRFCFHDATDVAGPIFSLAWSESALIGSCRIFGTVSPWVFNAKFLTPYSTDSSSPLFCFPNFKLTTHSSQNDSRGNLSREFAWYICLKLSSFTLVHCHCKQQFSLYPLFNIMSFSCCIYWHSWGYYLLFYLSKISFIWHYIHIQYSGRVMFLHVLSMSPLDLKPV